MTRALALAALIVAASACAAKGVESPKQACAYDRAAMLALDIESFDQDLDGGWRAVAENPFCDAEVADLLADYQRSRTDIPVKQKALVKFHEFQLRATAGQTERALKLIGEIRSNEDDISDRLYQEATEAFLKRDRAGLLAARNALIALPEPPEFAAAMKGFSAKYPDSKPPRWPVNLDVVDAFIACFDKTYKVAYGSPECRAETAAR